MVFPYLTIIHQINIYGLMLLASERIKVIHQIVHVTYHYGQDSVLHHNVGSSYYCESGSPTGLSGWHTSDPLWDGMQCGGAEGPCCSNAGLPWFSKNTPTPTTATINVRICLDEVFNNENIGIECLELFVK